MPDIFDMFNLTRYGNSEVITPQNIVSDMVDLLPQEVFNPDTTFLDPAVKSGRFLKEIYTRLFKSDSLITAFPDENERREHILHNQLFGIALSATAATLSRFVLYKVADIRGNIIYDDNYIARLSKRDETGIRTIIKGAFDIMQFDIVIGNPPYNNDLYLDFVSMGHRLSKQYTCMITPAKWQAKGGKKNEDFRQNIVPYMSKIVYYPCTEDIFNIRECSGISYYCIYKSEVKEKLVKIKCTHNSIIQSDFEKHDEKYVSLQNIRILNIIGKVGQLGEGFKQSLYVKNTDHGENGIMGKLGFKRQEYVGEQDRGNNKATSDYVEIMQGEKCVGYRKRNELFTTLKLDKYKITTSIMAGNIYLDDNGQTLGIVPCNILKPNQVPKGSYPVIAYFNTFDECKSFKSYYESKLVSFLFYFGACGSTLTREFYRFIPDQPQYDHIFTDQELYQKYNLTPEEITIIESVIKERN